MSGLRNYVPKRETVRVDSETTFEVGALSAEIILTLCQDRMPELRKLFDEADERGLVKAPNPMAIGMMLKTLAPDFVAEAIALSAGEGDLAHVYRNLSIVPTLDAVSKIMKLTFEGEGGLKKFGETLVDLLKMGTGALQPLTE